MPLLKTDFHIHTKYLKCANETMEVRSIVKECERLGLACIGITDHLNSLDKLEFHNRIREDIERLEGESTLDIYFGVELNFVGCDQGFAFNEEVKQEYGFQFAIGGIHTTYLEQYDLKKIIDIQHRHHIKTCKDPLCDVLVHPYWFWRGEFTQKGWPIFDSMKDVPESYARELGQVAKETGTAIEVNWIANIGKASWGESFVREYIDYLSIIASEGPIFCVGSDSHDIGDLGGIHEAYDVVLELGIGAERRYHPSGDPLIRGINAG